MFSSCLFHSLPKFNVYFFVLGSGLKYRGYYIAAIGAGKTQESEIVFQVPYLNLMGKGLSMTLFQNTAQLKVNMSFTLTLSVNGETITTTQNLTAGLNDTPVSISNEPYGISTYVEELNKSITAMSGLALGELGIVSDPQYTGRF